MQDLRWAIRSLLRSPGFTIVAGLVLALAIGATTAIFSVVNAVLLRPLPYATPEQLAAISSVYAPEGAAPRDIGRVTLTELTRWRQSRPNTIESMGAFAYTEVPIQVGQQAFSPVTALVDPEFLPTLGVRLARGTHFDSTDTAAERTAIISHRLWAAAFGLDSAVLGRSFLMNGEPFAVRAVMSRDFQFPRGDASYFANPVDLLLLPRALPAFPAGARQWFGIARIREGQSIEGAAEEMRLLVSRMAAEDEAGQDWSVSLTSLADATTKSSRTAVLIVLAVATVLLVIAAFNVMNLQFSRGVARLHAMTVSRAMGCSTVRLMRQLLLENAILAMSSGALAIAIAAVAGRAIVALSPVYLPVSGRIDIDATVLGFTLVVCVVTALISGLLPAVHAARSSDRAVHAAGSRATHGRAIGRMQRSLCVVQIALGIGLLSAAGALVGELQRLGSTDPGFSTDGVVGFSFSVPGDRSLDERRLFYQAALEEVRTIPGVISAGLITFLPPEIRAGVFMSIAIEGAAEPSPGSPVPNANHLVTSPGYFETVGMSMAAGRSITEGDNESGRPVVVVNEAFVARYFPDGNAIGRRVGIGFTGRDLLREIVGIVRDARDRGLDRQATPTIYIPFRQFALPYGSMAVRTSVAPTSIVPEVRRRLQRVDAGVPLVGVETLRSRLHASLAEPRFYTYLATVCAVMAVLFVTLGLYGIVSFSVSRRTPEFGVRMAVGASGPAILRLVLRQGAWMAGLGAAIGTLISLAFARVLETMPFEVRPADTTILAGTAAIVVVVALLATYVPARRASRVSPVLALRSD